MSYLLRWCVAIIAGVVAFTPALVFDQPALLPLSVMAYVAVDAAVWTCQAGRPETGVPMSDNPVKVHICALDRHCWKMWWQIAAPMRVHVGNRFWNIPVLTAIANWRTSRIWDLENSSWRPKGSEEQ